MAATFSSKLVDTPVKFNELQFCAPRESEKGFVPRGYGSAIIGSVIKFRLAAPFICQIRFVNVAHHFAAEDDLVTFVVIHLSGRYPMVPWLSEMDTSWYGWW